MNCDYCLNHGCSMCMEPRREVMSRLKLNIIVSDAASNIETTLQHTGVHYPTTTIVHTVEVDVPDFPKGFAIDTISICHEGRE